MTQIAVVGAVIVRDGLVLAAKRGGQSAQAGAWEFPGGKIERGETPDAALQREIREELRCGIRVGEHVQTTVHAYDAVTVELATFLCAITDGEPVATEHSELRWLAASDLARLDWAPADVPAVARVAELLG
ncbi:(deoxy)nucleoside triphosphate pyrophosphohydrolase [Microbacterium sp. MPKO10]|uniref:(deoxy)nucleoside triphosphate pyrophosphohydrolase n=1 Tax=Microbacterium sp. MPKO10 TaxID=2989818 RepID=UPI0022361319|nr:(deoxy)nucleoside triphosphate pyrophosphohydrolase [Microbacterium sp. MPKO10]MCW4457500.1 (deoxy)nucleoside triphosphate pyrophosphohydrolase [Microbacterium sp. MPKO10]